MELREKDFAGYLQESCPDTPEHFKRVVEQAVAAQCAGAGYASAGELQGSRRSAEKLQEKRGVTKGAGYASAKKRGSRRLQRVLLTAAAVLAIGCGAVAAGDFSFGGLLERWGITKPELAQTEAESEVSYPEDEPLMKLQDYYIDGTKLIFSAVAGDIEPDPEYGELQSKDHATVNGMDSMVESFSLDQDTGVYVGSIALPELEQTDTLDVTMRLYTASGIQEFTFTVESSNLSETYRIPDQECEVAGGTVEVKDISVAPSKTKLTLLYRFDGENGRELAESCQGLYRITDSSGNEIDTLHAGIVSVADPYESDGAYYRQITLDSLGGLDSEAGNLRFVPYEPETDSEGRVIPDTGTVNEEGAFTVNLK